MTKIKLCGLSHLEDIETANELCPEYVGFVFAKGSRRYVTPAQTKKFRAVLSKKILAVGVFVNENLATVSEILNAGIIDSAQLHGNEDADYIRRLRALTTKPIIKAFRADNFVAAKDNPADFILIDAGAGDGKTFDWHILENFKRDYFLAGGLNAENVSAAIKLLKPFAVDVSSGIETNGRKDSDKMREFVLAVRGELHDK